MAGSNPSGTDYVITIEATLGQTSSSAPVTVTIKNPCLDPQLLSVTAVTPPDVDYTLFFTAPNNQWTYFDFIINGSPAVKQICGDLVYTVDGGVIDNLLTHNNAQNQISIYAEYRPLVDNSPYVYTVTSELANYPGYGVASDTGLITIIDICDDPFSVTAGSQVALTFDYSSPVTFSIPGLVVNPNVCLPEREAICTF